MHTHRNGLRRLPSLLCALFALPVAGAAADAGSGADASLKALQFAEVGAKSKSAGPVLKLDKMEVSASQQTFYNSIDRKVYLAGRDLRSAGGSASDLLQNVPSVDVDVDGNVSLRGDPNVLILIDGKPSSLMSARNRADVLQQMPAGSIERIEVITNPSARYRPDGTAGIINLVLKRDRKPGLSGVVSVNVGDHSRWNTSLSLNYNPGPYDLFSLLSVRDDDRLRFSDESRWHLDAATGAPIVTRQSSIEHMRRLSRLGEWGVDCRIDPHNQLHATLSYNYLSFFRVSTVSNFAQPAGGPETLDYDRHRIDPEWHKTWEGDARYQHLFAAPGHELDVEVKRERHQELEDNQYRNVYRVPPGPDGRDNTRMNPTDTTQNLMVDYADPLANGAKLEAGYDGDQDKYDTDFRADSFDPASASWIDDAAQTNRFLYKDWIDAVYATYGRPLGRFAFLAGLRAERTLVHTDQVTLGLTGATEYYRLHPTLHLTYNLSDASQLQLSYSHRVHRPESDDLNPFPEYQDPYNLRAGNPNLRPEETHSIEGGYQYQRDDTTYLATVYFRDTYHAFTSVTRYVDAVTLLTTNENLASKQSGGLELVATTPLGGHFSVNASSDAFYSQVDASNLGYAARRSTVAWSAKAEAEWRPAKRNLFQFDLNYSAKRLTAQGYRMPSFHANVGYRHDFTGKNLAFVLTLSDVFDTLKERTLIDTPTLRDDYTRRQRSRVLYAGLIYTFGAAPKKSTGLQYDSGD